MLGQASANTGSYQLRRCWTYTALAVRRAVVSKRDRALMLRPVWPTAEFIVGNPPFIGASNLRARLGEQYAEALWRVHRHVNASADFVMYWWDRAAEILT